MRDLVAQRRERTLGELVVAALGLLDGQDVDVAAFQPRGDPVGPGADRVDVPGRQAHDSPPYGVPRARSPRLGAPGQT